MIQHELIFLSLILFSLFSLLQLQMHQSCVTVNANAAGLVLITFNC